MTPSAVVTPHCLSARAGADLLELGGNAVDAAIAAIATQGVVAPETCGLGGDLFALVHQPGWQTPLALNASGRSGSGADADTLRSIGATEVPRDHAMTVTVPGCVDGLVALSARLGRLPLAASLERAIETAAEGFEVSTEQAREFSLMFQTYSGNPAVAEFYPDHNAVSKGETVRRTNLARTLSDLATGGREAFYKGLPGDDIIAALGGTMTSEDLDHNNSEWIDPIGCEVAGLTAWTTPPNSQGYLGPGSLAVFEMLDPPDDPAHPDWWHLLVESYRCLAWERNDIVADPTTAPLNPDLLLNRDRLARAAETVNRKRAGQWPTSMGKTSGTCYLNVVDSNGMAVSLIQSNYRGTGSPFGAARSGFLLQDRGGGFSLTPGHPNELAPHKRPLHTLSPTLWTDGDQPGWVIGTRGGSVQPQLVAQLGARTVLAGHDLESSQAAPRWTVQEFGPDAAPNLSVEPGLDRGLLAELENRGHLITQMDTPQQGWGPMSIIKRDEHGVTAAADPRVDTTKAILS